MEKDTIIYGASDDLLEIDGEYSEEMNPPDDEFHVAVSDGTLLRINYDGDWRIQAIVRGTGLVKIIPSEGDDGKHTDKYAKYTSYSDLAIFHGLIRFVAITDKVVRFKAAPIKD